MQPSLDYLRTFVAVYRTGSFTSAAGMVGLSQPAVSNQMQMLERQLGYLLFERNGRRVVATARARALAMEIGPHLDAIEASTEPELGVPSGQARIVHIGGPAEYLSERVVPLLADLVDLNLEFRITFGLPESLLPQLSSGAFDLVVSSIYPRLPGVSSKPLMDEEFVLVAAPTWRSKIAEFGLESPESLEGLPIVAYSDDLAIVRRYWRTVFERTTEGILPVATVPDLRGVRDAVVSGLGISVLPQYLVADLIARGMLVVLNEPQMPPLNTLHVATQEGVLQKDRVVRLVQDALLADAHRLERGIHDEPSTETT